MKTRLSHYHTWIAAILLVALVVPRCLMASDIAGTEKKASQYPPCHGIQEASESSKVFAQLTCAQQCEQSVVSSLTVKKPDFKFQDYSFVVVINTHTPVFSPLTSVVLHQGWPPDNQFLLSNTPDIYLDTGRLRL